MSRSVIALLGGLLWPDTRAVRDAFIYEYVGDVVSNPSFIKRMREYAEEGIDRKSVV